MKNIVRPSCITYEWQMEINVDIFYTRLDIYIIEKNNVDHLT